MRWLLGFQWLLLGGLSAILFTACATPVATPPALVQCMPDQDRFIRYANQTLLDQCTQLMWMTQDFRVLEGQAPERWREALAWADKINRQRFGGYADWRPATLEAYKTIYHPQSSKRSYKGNTVGYPEAFADGGGEWYWVEEVAVWGTGHVHQAYTYSFQNGKTSSRWVHTEHHPQQTKYNTGSIRLLRGPIAVAAQQPSVK